jgi:hypothetical protein
MKGNVRQHTPISLQRAGFDALVNALGAVDAIRFIRLYDNGHGDYTKERHAIFESMGDMSVDDVLTEIAVRGNKRTT